MEPGKATLFWLCQGCSNQPGTQQRSRGERQACMTGAPLSDTKAWTPTPILSASPKRAAFSNVLPLHGRAQWRRISPPMRADPGWLGFSWGKSTVPSGRPRPTDWAWAWACAAASGTQFSLALTVLGADRLPSAAVPEHGQRALHLQETEQTSLPPQTTDRSALRPDSGHHGGDHGVERPERRRGGCWVTRPARPLHQLQGMLGKTYEEGLTDLGWAGRKKKKKTENAGSRRCQKLGF